MIPCDPQVLSISVGKRRKAVPAKSPMQSFTGYVSGLSRLYRPVKLSHRPGSTNDAKNCLSLGMKKLPIGLQDFGELRRGGFVYVDKTELLYRLATEGKYYRPNSKIKAS